MIKKIYVYVFGKNVNREQVIIMLSLEGIFYEIEENEIWSFNYNIMEGVISLSLVNPYTAQRHEMKIEKIYNIFFVHSTNKKKRKSGVLSFRGDVIHWSGQNRIFNEKN